MGKGTRENEGWNLAKEEKGCREEEEKEKHLGFLEVSYISLHEPVLILRKGYS
jgi:hypothetical protein